MPVRLKAKNPMIQSGAVSTKKTTNENAAAVVLIDAEQGQTQHREELICADVSWGTRYRCADVHNKEDGHPGPE